MIRLKALPPSKLCKQLLQNNIHTAYSQDTSQLQKEAPRSSLNLTLVIENTSLATPTYKTYTGENFGNNPASENKTEQLPCGTHIL